MNTRQRFLATLRDGVTGVSPRYEREVTDEVREVWETEGLPPGADLLSLFGLERWQVAGYRGGPGFDLMPRPPLEAVIRTPEEAADWKTRYQLADRFEPGWKEEARRLRERAWPLGISATRGLFQTFGVKDGDSLIDHLYFLADCPAVADDMIAHLIDWTVSLVDQVLDLVVPDFMMFGEPIASHHGPVVGPRSFRRFVVPLYRAVVERARRRGVALFIWEVYGNVVPLLDEVLAAGINVLWIGHAVESKVDYLELRDRLGPKVGLIGGLDARTLRQGPDDFQAEIEGRAVPLLAEGRYIPMLDDRPRIDTPFQVFREYAAAMSGAMERFVP